MSEQMIMDISLKTVWLAVQLAAPVLLASMIMGLVVSIFQAATQVNEQTLSFIPKIVAMTIALIVFGPWMIKIITQFTMDMINMIPSIGS